MATATFSLCEVRNRRMRLDCDRNLGLENGMSLEPDVDRYAVNNGHSPLAVMAEMDHNRRGSHFKS